MSPQQIINKRINDNINLYKGDPNDREQFLIARGRGTGTVIDEYRKLENVHVTLSDGSVYPSPYVHGWWKRKWNNTDGDTWHRPINNDQPFCITTVSSLEGDPTTAGVGSGPFMAGTHSHPHKPYTEIHCQGLSTQCPQFTPSPTTEPTDAPTESPTALPTPQPTRALVPSTPLEVDPDICAWANMTLFVLVDASESIAGTNWDLSKQWIVDVYDDANKVIKKQEEEWRNSGYDIILCMRTSLIIFSSVVTVVWDLNANGKCYNAGWGMFYQ